MSTLERLHQIRFGTAQHDRWSRAKLASKHRPAIVAAMLGSAATVPRTPHRMVAIAAIRQALDDLYQNRYLPISKKARRKEQRALESAWDFFRGPDLKLWVGLLGLDEEWVNQVLAEYYPEIFDPAYPAQRIEEATR